MSKADRVQRLYAVGAGVYGPLIRLWNKAVATQAEKLGRMLARLRPRIGGG